MGRAVKDRLKPQTYIWKRSWDGKWTWNCFHLNINCDRGDDESWNIVRAEALLHYNRCHREVSRAEGPGIEAR